LFLKPPHFRASHLLDHNRAPFVPVKLEYKPSADVRGPQKEVMVNPRVLEYENVGSA
jgi:hypothetical protein